MILKPTKRLALAVCLTTLVGVACGIPNEIDPASPEDGASTTTTGATAAPPTGTDVDQPPDTTAATTTTERETSPPTTIERETSPPTTTSEAGKPAATGSTPDETTDTADDSRIETDSGGDLASLYEEEIAEIIETVESIRELEFLEPPNVVLLSVEDFNERKSEGLDLGDNLTELEIGEGLYKLLGLMPEEDSLEQYYKDLFTAGVVGFYDDDTKEVVVPIHSEGISLLDRQILIHELVHALTDQHFDFSALAAKLDEADEEDALAALGALIEGDAMLVEETHFNDLSSREQRELSRETRIEPPEATDTRAIPYFVTESISFYYIAGRRFVGQLEGKGGMEAINAAYIDPPVSTEQAYFPGSYPGEVPLDVEHPIADVSGYELARSATWGEYGFETMFNQIFGILSPIGFLDPWEPDDSEYRESVKGWGGDRYSLWSRGAETAFALTYRGDETSDASEMYEEMQNFVSTAMDVGEPDMSGNTTTWSGADYAWLSISGDYVRFIAATDPEVGVLLADHYGEETPDLTTSEDSTGESEDTSEEPGDSSEGTGDSSGEPGDSSEGTGDSFEEPEDSSEEPGDSSEEQGGLPEDDAEEPLRVADASSADITPDAVNLASRYNDVIADLVGFAQRVRGLQFKEPPNVVLLNPESFNQRVAEDLEEALVDLDAAEELYTLLGLLEPEDSLTELYREMYSGSIAGFYDAENSELVVPLGAEGIGPIHRRVLIHELIHALTDQHFNFTAMVDTLIEEKRFEERSALNALIEGDARLAENLYYQYVLSAEERDELDKAVWTRPNESANPWRVPSFLRDAFYFRYISGSNFVREIHADRDYSAINAIYSNPPASTEQIYFPQSYPDELPLNVDHLGFEVEGYELQHSSTWGEMGFAVIFDQIFGKSGESGHTRASVKGWGGDRYSFWFNGEDVVFDLDYRGDTQQDAVEFAAAMREYITVAMDTSSNRDVPQSGDETAIWEGNDFAWLTRTGDEVKFVAASDPNVGAKLVSAYETEIWPD